MENMENMENMEDPFMAPCTENENENDVAQHKLITKLRNKLYMSAESFYESYCATMQSLITIFMMPNFYQNINPIIINSIFNKELESRPNSSVQGICMCLALLVHVMYTVMSVLFFEIFKLFIIWIGLWCFGSIAFSYGYKAFIKFKIGKKNRVD
jgi:fatty-acid desaturase